MDKTLTSGEEAVVDKVPENDTGGKGQPDVVEMKETAGDSPSRSGEPDGADEDAAERPGPDSVPKDENNLCTNCGFAAKCPRSLKIHSARKHGKTPDKSAKPPEKNSSDASPAEIQEDSAMETGSGLERAKPNQDTDHDEQKQTDGDNDTSGKGANKKASESGTQQADQEDVTPTQERRISKRTPKPKIIYSCNYCGQEFRDKSPLDVHTQRYHSKDTPYTCEYALLSCTELISSRMLNSFYS